MERDYGSTIVWFVGGLALGAAVALLIAPETGERTRKKLVDQAEEGKKTLIQSGRELYEKGRDLYERGREIVEDAAALFEHGRSIAEKRFHDNV
jgi:gas vesicle protein